MNIQEVLLKDFSSLHIGGKGKIVVVKNEEELVEAVMHAKAVGLRVHIIGEGTNTYFGEDLSEYLFIKNEIKGVEFRLEVTGCTLLASSGETWDDIVMLTVEKGLWGIENLSLIPGTIGGAPVQNIGAYGAELADVFVSLRALDITTIQFVELSKEFCAFGYRDSIFKRETGRYIVTSLRLLLSQEKKPILSYKPLDSLLGKTDLTIADVRDLVVKIRTEKLPDYKVYPNAGSFFKNPIVGKQEGDALLARFPGMPLHKVGDGYKIPAAWLIEHVAQMKGMRIGAVGTWPNQPLVMVNYNEATANEFQGFIELITQKVEKGSGVNLHQEVNFVD